MRSNYKQIQAGNIVVFNEIEYIVLKNFGCCGLVKENRKDGAFINNFEWKEDMTVLDKSMDCSIIERLIKEFESFFRL
jgi:hypothetical protein